ncbi:hypothetical protein AC579_6379 [Pseudocercospora musae]|uniref:Uncharacterized protein n=1 Tax=Pseudocercospora musae TaxID=113226 RepID=A0A139IJF3_9PEZI|nr:hypothetical protein AC579_6379 [Pseudocercospora musae]
MAPPVKRRKLSSTSRLEIHRDNCTGISDTSSRYSFTTSPRPNAASPVHTSLPRVEEEKAWEVLPALRGIENFNVLLPRQGIVAAAADLSVSVSVSVSVAPTIAYQDASTTITYTPPATPSLPTLPSISGATTFSTTSISTSSTSTSAATIGNSTSITTAEATSASRSRITSAPHSLTTSSIDTNSTRSSSRTTSSVSADTFFIATLSAGDTTTITRARTAYVTTVADGEVFTIPGLSSTLSTSGASSTVTTSDSEQSTVTATALINGSNAASPGAYGTPATSAPSSSTSPGSASNNDSHNNSNSPPPAGTIAGGVVGGCAGLAVIVLIAMLFVRWYRRRSRLGHQALPPASSDSPEQHGDLPRGPGMAERAGLMPLAAAVPAKFRHQNRSTEPSESPERGFTRISGRKLPSAWSEGMSSPPLEMPLNAATTSTAGASASYYRDSQGQYGGDGTGFPPSSPTASPTSPASSHGPLRSSTHEMMTMSPGPQRQPQLHAGGPYGFVGAPSGVQRSDTPSSLDPSRNSRFTEEM